MFGQDKENNGEKTGFFTRLKNFFMGKKEPETFDMNDLQPDLPETADQPDIATYSRYTDEYREFLASQEQQQNTERTIPDAAGMTETEPAEDNTEPAADAGNDAPAVTDENEAE